MTTSVTNPAQIDVPASASAAEPTNRSTRPLVACRGVSVRYAIRYHYSATFKDSLFQSVRRLVGRGQGLDSDEAQKAAGDGPGRGAHAGSGEDEAARSGRGIRSFQALDGIDLEIHPGDVVGLIGRNGAGKSTLLRHLAGIEEPDVGVIERHGTIGSLLNLSTGFKSELSGKENVYLRGAILGLPRSAVDALMPKIVDFCELGEFMYAPFRTYSAGMKARLGFAVAIHINPDVLLLDEVIGVGDEKFKRKAGSIFDHMGSGRAIVLATHDSGTIKRYCNKCAWLDRGRIHRFGPADDVADEYMDAMTAD